MAFALVPVVLGYEVTTLEAFGFTLQFIFKFHKSISIIVLGIIGKSLIYKVLYNT